MLAERGRFLEAGALAGLAILTRAAGVALLPALAVIAWRAATAAARSPLAVAPLLFAAYPLVLWRQVGDAWAFCARRISGTATSRRPGRSAASGTACAPAGPASSSSPPARTRTSTGRRSQDTDPMRVGAVNLECLAFLVLFVALTVVAWRRFGAPYGLFAALSLAIPLSLPSERWPLLSLPRFGLVLFPLFLALAVIGGRPRVHTAIVAVSALLLGVAVIQWALWQWVA